MQAEDGETVVAEQAQPPIQRRRLVEIDQQLVATFERLGLPYVIVAATAGAMGGSASEEFLVGSVG